MSEDVVRVRALISGRVQGVGYRQACVRRAMELGLAGTVENLPDGRVEAHLEGPARLVEAMLDWCSKGPSHALVTGLERQHEAPTGERGFSTR